MRSVWSLELVLGHDDQAVVCAQFERLGFFRNQLDAVVRGFALLERLAFDADAYLTATLSQGDQIGEADFDRKIVEVQTDWLQVNL